MKEAEEDDPTTTMYCLDILASAKFGQTYMREVCPTLTRTCAGSGGYYLSSWQRMLSTRDICKLQGFPTDVKRGPATERQFRMMLGNSMTVPVMARILCMALAAGGYIDLDAVPDPVLSPQRAEV